MVARIALAVAGLLLYVQAGAAGECKLGSTSGCSVGSAKVEINLGWTPLDKYFEPNNGGYIPRCKDDPPPAQPKTVRKCIQDVLAYYRNANHGGATGVRFSFGMAGGACSSPFKADAPGKLKQAWLSNLQAFLADVKAAGYEKITPNPGMGYHDAPPWNGCPLDDQDLKYEVLVNQCASGQTCLQSCPAFDQGGSSTNKEKLRFVPWLPYGINTGYVPEGDPPPPDWVPASTAGWADPACFEKPDAYSQAVRNTYNFWGWGPYFNLVRALLYAAKCAGLQVEQFEIHCEVDLLNFPVQARLIYDYDYGAQGGTDVFGTVQTLLNQILGASAGTRVTYATQASFPSLPASNGAAWNADGYDCPSAYNETAMLLLESELQAAFDGGRFGFPVCDGANCPQNPQNLLCGGKPPDTSWGLPVDYYDDGKHQRRTVNSIYMHLCVENPYYPGYCFFAGSNCTNAQCSTTHTLPDDYAAITARNFFDGVYNFLSSRGITGNTVVFEPRQMQNPITDKQPDGTWDVSEQPPSDCWRYFKSDMSMPYSTVNGFNGYNDGSKTSSLLFPYASNVVFHPWSDLMNECHKIGTDNESLFPPYKTQ